MSVLLFRDDPADPHVHPVPFMEIAPPVFIHKLIEAQKSSSKVCIQKKSLTENL